MNDRDSQLERLLRAARGEADAPGMPYGFDTRVVALARATRRDRGSDARVFARVFRRIATGAIIVAACASAAAYWQMQENEELAEPSSNAYALVDTAIFSEFSP